jgi:hypothetical protein
MNNKKLGETWKVQCGVITLESQINSGQRYATE